jgi:chemotaxis protein CheX
MNATASTFCVGEIVRRVVPAVFDTMLSLPVAARAVSPAQAGERVTGAVGMGGENISGEVYLHFSTPLARRAAAAMLGLPSAGAADDIAVNDTTSELANMVAGAIKSALCDAGRPCGMSTPSIMRGPAFAIEVPPGATCELFCFDCQGETLGVEVQLKLD